MTIVGALLMVLPIDFTTAQVLGMIVDLPVVMLKLAVAGIGIVRSVMRFQDWPSRWRRC